MAVLDIILLLLFIPGIIKGVSKGFLEQLTGIISLVAGAWAAFRFSTILSLRLEAYLALEPRVLSLICFIAIVIVVVTALNLFCKLIVKALKAVSLNWINRLLGFVFGIMKTALILGLVISVFEGLNSKWKIVEEEKLENSIVYDGLSRFSDTVFPFLEGLLESDGARSAAESIKNTVENV